MKIFYHLDNDGKCAAYWVKKCAKHYDKYTKEFIEINYGREFPFEDIMPNEQIFIVDYSIFPEEMERLFTITKDVVWIDHHVSAINRYNDPKYSHLKIKGIRNTKFSGCLLTYLYFNKTYYDLESVRIEEEMEESVPLFTRLINDYDIWKFRYGEDTKAFEAGLQLYHLDPEKDFWEELYDEVFVDRIIEQGESILKYRDKWAADYCEHYGFAATFEGHKIFAMNLAMISSEYFKSINSEEYDLLIGFAFNGESWVYSLRSEKIDCSKIAVKYGGGGHPGAAGFSYDHFLFGKNN